MRDVIVLCPSRGRPGQAFEMWRSLAETAKRPSTRLVLAVDRDDPEFGRYLEMPAHAPRFGYAPDAPFVMGLDVHQTGNLTRATNSAAARFWHRPVILGHVGDDHRFRTPGWDDRIAEVLAEPGIAYGDDLLQGEELPTAVFMSAEIPRALGWFALPACTHSHIDNAWKRIGQELGTLHYLPDVVIEHMHPAAGKAPRDRGYVLAGRAGVIDGPAYEAWVQGGMADDLSRVRGALA